MKRITTFLYCILIITGFACRESYNPPIVSSPDSYLVVEGVLNVAAAPTVLRLTRTYKLDKGAQVTSENNAQVAVEGKDNTVRQLTMTTGGTYVSSNLNLVFNQEYRLRITTKNGKEYLSEYVIARKTPSIDSIGFRQEEDGVQVYVNAHDDANKTRYYRWDFDETWEIKSYYYSTYKFTGPETVIRRTGNDFEYVCWKYSSSKLITLGSTAALASDILYRAPVTFMSNGDEKLAVRYSILLRQYALDKREYEFYSVMKKNTESLGTIFDAQPSEQKGNIKCTSDPDEPVIGFVSASTIEEQRFFIDNTQLDRWRFEQDCPKGTVPNNPDSLRNAYEGGYSIIGAVGAGNPPAAYEASYKRCVECTARGGSLAKPSYW
jgi:hypothetical protein